MEEGTKTRQHPFIFFKLMIPEVTAHQMRFPPMFLEQISEETSNKITLKGPDGRHWSAKLSRTKDGTFIRDGWVKFLNDNDIGNLDFLLFRYWGNLFFEVEIYGKNGCKRIYETIIETTHQLEPSVGEKDPPKKQGLQQQKDIAASAKLAPATSIRVNPSRKKLSQPPKDVVGSATLAPSTSNHVNPSAKRRGRPPKNVAEEPTARGSSSTKIATVEGAAQILNFTSSNPNFQICLKPTHLICVHVPVCFAERYLRGKTQVILQGPRGEARTVKLLWTSNKQYVISKGWIKFTHQNNFKEGDICIFELTGEYTLLVHHYPVGDKST